jgi:hypothetical protein
MLNPSGPTRRPRAPSPPPSYSASATAASGPTLGASPAYTPYADGAHPAIPAAAASTAEDPHAFLSHFDTVFLIDDSGSMAGRSWRETRAALAAIVPICTAHDTDGVDIFFLNHRTSSAANPVTGIPGSGYSGVRSLAEVEEMFEHVRPWGGTPTGTRLNHILRPYLRHYRDEVERTQDETCLKPLNIIVITDGVPSDDPGPVIIQHAKKLDALEAPPYQVGIQFFQVGNEPGAAAALRELDDELSGQVVGGARDMVDTVTFDATTTSSSDSGDVGVDVPTLTGDGILKTVLGAVVKRLDRVQTARPRSRGGDGR